MICRSLVAGRFRFHIRWHHDGITEEEYDALYSSHSYPLFEHENVLTDLAKEFSFMTLSDIEEVYDEDHTLKSDVLECKNCKARFFPPGGRKYEHKPWCINPDGNVRRIIGPRFPYPGRIRAAKRRQKVKA